MKSAALGFFYYGLVSCQVSVLDVGLCKSREGALQLTHTLNANTVECDTTNWRHGFMTCNEMDYSDIKDRIADSLESLKKLHDNHLVTGEAFTHLLVYQLIPYWYGTPWAFEGYSATPNTGSIACGYFVSTTLLHMGLHVNRYKLAQQLPVHEALSIAGEDRVLTVEILPDTNRAEALVQACPENGVYFIGFDQSHVGYLYRSGACSFIIHSDYLSTGVVAIESALNSPVLNAYSRYYIAPISTNEWLMNCWLTGKEISIIETPDD